MLSFDNRWGDVPRAMLLVLLFDVALLRAMICFLGPSVPGKRLYEKGFELDGRGILSVDSDINETTSLLWIKIGLPWIEPTTSNLSAPQLDMLEHIKEKIPFRL